MLSSSGNKGMDKFVTPYRFWDEFITGNVLALVALGLHWMNFSNGVVDRMYFAGLLCGLIGGQLAVCLIEIARTRTDIKVPLRMIGYLLHSLVLFGLLFISVRLAVGYFFGLGITLCFGFALVALVRKPREVAGTGPGLQIDEHD